MKTLDINHLGKKYLEKYKKITVKSLFKEIEDQIRTEMLKIRLNGLEIVYTNANYGGYRRWFKCPFCNNKVFTLYNIGGKFKCRKCLNLPYRSQMNSGKNVKKVIQT